VDVLVAIIVAWLVGGGSMCGIGLLLFRVSRRPVSDERDYLDAFWMGLAATVALGQVWHIWLPMDARFAVVIVGLGVVGVAVSRLALDLARGVRAHRLATAVFAVGALWLAVMGLRPLEIYDAGLYHLQAVIWNARYPTVPGLGNLHGRLAFFSSFFLLLAAFAQGALADDAYRAVAGLLTLVFLTQVGISVARAARATRTFGLDKVEPADALLALMALPTLATIGSNGLATTTPDLPLFPLQVLIVYYLMRWMQSMSSAPDRAPGYLGEAMVIAALSVTIKLSGLGFAVACGVFVAGVVIIRVLRSRSMGHLGWPPVLSTVISAVLIGGMLINSVILSGYPLYPSTLWGAPVDWRVSETQANVDRTGVELFARQPAELAAQDFQGWTWLPSWLAVNGPVLLAPVVAAVLGLLVLGYIVGSRGPCRRKAWLVLPLYVGIVIWFAAAPSPRFAGALLWLAGSVPLALAVSTGTPPTRWAVWIFVLICLVPPQAVELSLVLREPVAVVRYGITSVPVVNMQILVTNSGLELFVPREGEQAWAGPIPSTPIPDKRLRLRCPDSLACGFAIDA
jgi:hypothetical protein